VQITKLLIKPTPTERILMPLVSVRVHVHVMGVLFPTVLWIFKKANGMHANPFLLTYGSLLTLRHMNIDYAICQALNHNTAGLSEALVEYDVACQWSINFAKRLEDSTTLHIPPGLSWVSGVGKFHLGTHERTCFAKFSLNFIQGAGQQDGEILETLWAPLNKIGSSIRAMSKPGRQETVDDHMRDSNWKKSTKIGAVPLISTALSNPHVHIVRSLTQKLKKALKEETESQRVFKELDSSVDHSTRKTWTKQEHVAMKHRGHHLHVYEAQLHDCKIISLLHLE
jgi:hypothetical protein